MNSCNVIVHSHCVSMGTSRIVFVLGDLIEHRASAEGFGGRMCPVRGFRNRLMSFWRSGSFWLGLRRGKFLCQPICNTNG